MRAAWINTHFLIAQVISSDRSVKVAKRLFRKVLEVAGRKPGIIVTDSLPAYDKAYRKVFRTLSKPRTEHIKITK